MSKMIGENLLNTSQNRQRQWARSGYSIVFPGLQFPKMERYFLRFYFQEIS